jgi:hypothetical protein
VQKYELLTEKAKPLPDRNPLTNKPKPNTMTINHLSIMLAAQLQQASHVNH